VTDVAVKTDADPADASPAEFAPSDPSAAAAMRTLRAGRLAQATKLIAALPDTMALPRAWKHFMQADLARRRQAIGQEEGELLKTIGVLQSIGCGAEHLEAAPMPTGTEPHRDDAATDVDDPREGRLSDPAHDAFDHAEARRLMIHALSELGRIFRRREDADSARRVHLRTWQYVARVDTGNDRWMVASEIGLDEDVAGRIEEAKSWHARAVELAQRAAVNPHAKHARSATLLANTLWAGSDAAGSIQAARQACAAWRRHDAAAVQVPRADLFLAGRLLDGAGQALERDHIEEAQARVREARSLLGETREALAAFDAPARLDLALCDELREFADRLHASLEGA